MAGSFVQVPIDSTGKKLQTFNNTVGSDSVHSEGVTLVRSSDNSEVGVSGQPVRIDPTGTTTQPISDAGGSLTVDGTFFQSTQPVSVADGSDTTLGAKADAKSTATDTTAISAMSVLKQISASVQAPPSQAVTNAGTFAVQAAQSGTWNVTNVSGTISLPTGAATAAKQPALGSAGSASADVISIQGIASMTAVKVDGSAVTQPVSFGPATSGGTSAYHAVAAASNNAAAVKGSAGQVYGWSIYNNAAYPVYVKLYNKATSPAPATDNALLIKVIGVQAGTYFGYFNVCGIAGFSNGIGIAAVKGITDTDNTSLLLSDCLIEIDYK